MELSAREALITLNLIPGLGSVRIRSLLEHFGSADMVLAAPQNLLAQVPRIGPTLAAAIADWRHCTHVEAELDCAAKAGVRITTLLEDDYPDVLRRMSDPPVVLYSRGTWQQDDARRAVSVVGTRIASPYGIGCARSFSRDLADAGSCIISGLARGIDTAAHLGALDAGGRTIAILGGGLASIFPPENMALADRIADGHGALVSEFPMNMTPSRNSFPQRNRVVAAWSCATLVVEAAGRSGALHTAGLAADMGKSVFAVPGAVTTNSSLGCHQLIRDGAILCTCAADLISDMGWEPDHQLQIPLFSEHAMAAQNDPVLSAIAAGYTTLDALCSALGTSAAELTPRLMRLQIERRIIPAPGGAFELCPPPGKH